MESMRKRPLAAITAIWEKNSVSKYPDGLKVPMNDGHVIDYTRPVEQPHPCFLNAMELLQTMPKGLGYQYHQPKSPIEMCREWHKKVRGL